MSSSPPKVGKRAPKVGGFAAHFACGFLEFWRGGTRSRIVFLEVFAKCSLFLSDNNTDPGGRHGNKSRHPLKNCHRVALAGSGALLAALHARAKSWQFLRGVENCCHGMGTHGASSTSEHYNNYLCHPSIGPSSVCVKTAMH